MLGGHAKYLVSDRTHRRGSRSVRAAGVTNIAAALRHNARKDRKVFKQLGILTSANG
ncbi:MAG: hypothetical protein JXA67_21035 [Micromonosporaceae bacterium]|nr:hypothetical protein [Micromonosporaceae bacterium]